MGVTKTDRVLLTGEIYLYRPKMMARISYLVKDVRQCRSGNLHRCADEGLASHDVSLATGRSTEKNIYISANGKQRSIFNYSFNIRGPQEKEKIIFVVHRVQIFRERDFLHTMTPIE